jgi:hypothetical protein
MDEKENANPTVYQKALQRTDDIVDDESVDVIDAQEVFGASGATRRNG